MVTIGLYFKELADLYASKTLARYLRENNRDINLYFTSECIDPEKEGERIWSELLRGEKFIPKESHFDKPKDNLEVSFCSDRRATYDITDSLELGVDITLLKNSIYPYNSADKEKLRIKNGISLDERVLTIG